MNVDRLYPVHAQMYTIERLWAQESLFNDAPTVKGQKETLERLKTLHTDLGKVIEELSKEMEETEWLL